MRRIVLSIGLLAALVTGAQPAAAAQIDRGDFRFVRPLSADSDSDPVLVEPDGALFEHSLPGFADCESRMRAGTKWRGEGSRAGGVPQPSRYRS